MRSENKTDTVSSSNNPAARVDVTKQNECQCILCGECHGSGTIEFETNSYPEWDLEACGECEGSGYSKICDHCQFLEEMAEWPQ